MRTPGARPTNLPDACVTEAMTIIAEVGLEQLSLREVARRLGVSHQAPYRHFPSRDHLLAEVVARAYEAFAAYLDARPRHADPAGDLAAMGRAYLGYAAEHRLEYRLMFGTPLPDPNEHPRMLANARHAFSLLQLALARLARAMGQPDDAGHVDRTALFVWSALHGAASGAQADVLRTLPVSPALLADLHNTVLQHICDALGAPVRDSAAAALRP